MSDATPDQWRLHWILIGAYVAFAVAFAWAGAASRWPFFLGSATGVAAAVAELRTRTPYPAHEGNVHVVPSSWWTRRIPGLLGLPLVFFVFGAEYITHGNVPDGLGIATVAGLFVAVMAWTQRDVVGQVNVTEDGIVLRVLLGLRPITVVWRDVVSVMDRGDDAVLQVRGGKTYFVSHELSEFDALREKLKRSPRAVGMKGMSLPLVLERAP